MRRPEAELLSEPRKLVWGCCGGDWREGRNLGRRPILKGRRRVVFLFFWRVEISNINSTCANNSKLIFVHSELIFIKELRTVPDKHSKSNVSVLNK